MSLSQYEHDAWEQVQEAKRASLKEATQSIVPPSIRDRARPIAYKAKHVPGVDRVTAAYSGAARGLAKATGETALKTLRTDKVVARFTEAGYPVHALADIWNLDLKVIDAVAHFDRIRYRHAVAAATGGVGTAAAVTGATLLASAGTVASAGAAAAPGLGATAGAMAADSAGVLALSSRVVASMGAHYGYDPRDPDEQLFAMSVMGLGMAGSSSAKAAAYGELSKLTQELARRATWEKLNEHVLVAVGRKFAENFGFKLTQKKLGQLVPVAGIAIGAGLNYATIDRIASAAQLAYRERFLADKGRLTEPVPEGSEVVEGNLLSVLELLEEARRDEKASPDDAGSPPRG